MKSLMPLIPIQKSSNTLMCFIQCITAHSSAGHGTEYFLAHEGTQLFPVSSITKVHHFPPFDLDTMRMAVDMEKNGATRSLTNKVSA